MKRLQLMKFSVVLTLLFSLSSCLDSNDPEFGIVAGNAFIRQINQPGPSGSVQKTFAPYFAFEGNQPMKCRLTLDITKNYPMQAMSGTENTVWEIGSSYGESIYTSTIPNGTYKVVATNAKDEVYTNSYIFNIDKELGALKVNKLEYTVSGGIKAEWEPVENATAYYLLFSGTYIQDGAEKNGVMNIVGWDGGNTTANTGSFRGDNRYIQPGTKIRIAVVAAYSKEKSGMLALIGDIQTIVWGQSSEVEE